jgi:hypothetical protein
LREKADLQSAEKFVTDLRNTPPLPIVRNPFVAMLRELDNENDDSPDARDAT